MYLIAICTIFYFFEFNEKKSEKNPFDNIRIQTEKIKSDIGFDPLSNKLIDIYIQSKEYEIAIDKVLLKNSIINLIISAENKKKIYSFLKKNKEVKVENISYDKKLKVHIANAVYKINRK